MFYSKMLFVHLKWDYAESSSSKFFIFNKLKQL